VTGFFRFVLDLTWGWTFLIAARISILGFSVLVWVLLINAAIHLFD